MTRDEISKAISDLDSIEDVYVVLVTVLSVSELKKLIRMIEERRFDPFAVC